MRATRTRFSTHGPKAQRGTVIRFRLRKAGKVVLVVRADGSACSVIGRKRVRGHRGMNRVPFNGRVNGRALPVGKYTITVVVMRSGKRRPVGAVGVEVVPSGRHLTRAQRAAPVATGCFVAGTPSSLGSSILVALATPFVDGSTTGPQGRTEGKSGPSPGTLGPSFKPPKLPRAVSPHGDGRFGWAGMLLYGALFLAGAALLVQIGRFFSGSWNP
ncbi:MAG: hypothetical protein ACJ75Q_11170 [Gaiellaceae bacterium]